MPAPKRTRARAQTPEEDPPSSDGPEQGEQGAAPQLQFNEPLSWTAGRAISVGELLRRLDALYKELVQMEQDEFDLESLRAVAKELGAQRLIAHKDRGVKANTACCLVEILRMFAPEAPYTQKELKEIYTMFIGQIIPALADPSSPYNEQHIAVIRSLTEIKSILLIVDIPGYAQLAQALFTTSFDVLSGPSKASSGEEVSLNTEHTLCGLLVLLVEEAENLPDEVIDVVLAQFLRADPRTLSANGVPAKGKKGAQQLEERQATLLLKEAPAAYTMAQDICNNSPEKMPRYVQRYFNSVLLDVSMAFTNNKSSRTSHRRNTDDLDEDEAAQGPSDDDLKESRKAHLLLRELWRASPPVVQDIIPQLETELGTDNLPVRLMAVETVGDMIAGIGAAGPPLHPVLDPAAYPSQSLPEQSKTQPYHFLLTPSSSVAFASRYNSAYQAFLGRRHDKTVAVRAAWATAVGCIILTSAGGAGLETEEERVLIGYLADSLVDADDRVRLNAIKVIEHFSYSEVISKLGNGGSMSEKGSLLYNLADRVKDNKPAIRTDAIHFLSKLWGVAVGAIGEGSERTKELLGPIPSKLFAAYYINDPEINKHLDRVLFESLIPLSYPPVKARQPAANGTSQNGSKESQSGQQDLDIDKIRTERILLLVQSLDPKSRTAFLSKQSQQTRSAQYMMAFLKKCEDYNGGVVDTASGKDENEVKGQLRKLIDYLSSTLPEHQRAKDDLWKFAELHERRTYALIRFCCAPDSEWSKVRRSIKEITKRIEELITSSSSSSVLDTLLTLIYRSSVLIYNRSHVPAIIQFSRTDEKELGATAHEVLGEISKHKSEVFKAHVEELCKTLESDAPSATKNHRADATQDLKACADFARKFPSDIPQDPRFFRSLMLYIKHGQPQAAKYAVVILLTAADKKEMYAKDIYSSCAKGFKYHQPGFLSRLAALGQLVLLGSDYLETDEADAVVEIAISKVLTNYEEAYPEFDEEHNQAEWIEEPDENFKAKAWALKILINRLRAYPDEENVTGPAKPVYSFLETLIQKSGQFSTNHLAPEAHASRLRLLAAQHLLKLCRERRFNELLTHRAFNELAVMVQDPLSQVREGFVRKLMKYLGPGKLAKRFYTPLFLLAFEPDAQLRSSAETWLRSRAHAFARAKDTSLELLLARLISLLAHHPDFEPEGEPLREMAKYFIFYLRTVATRENISLIFHVAQRVKSVSDGIEKSSQSIYILSDLAQAIVRRWDERQDWGMQTWPGKVNLPAGVFAIMDNHDKAVEVASKMFVPADVMDDLDAIVQEGLKDGKGKKRGDGAAKSKKRARPASEAKKNAPTPKRAKVAKTPKRKTASRAKNTPASNSERRKSGRNSNALNYRDLSSDEDEDDIVDDESSVSYRKRVNGSASNARRATKEEEVVDVSDDVDSSSAMEEE